MMSINMKDVRAQLDPDEPDYAEAAKLGPDAIPFLKELVNGKDTMLASKAAYLASLIKSDRSVSVLEAAAGSREPVVRIAAASGIRNLSEQDASRVSDLLIEDQDTGVRKVTLKSISNFRSPGLVAKVKKLADKDPEPFIRDLASSTVRRMMK
ncbi:MAG: HEAT repeat domain-containing protein [Candidatus Methanoperedens sp.]|nr:HEAT repeat domain-containing protein [Candidatus Methanoperedens sp.]MCZ7359666.1 HEAT repeat domain-containing protein [Candidatus Methanoperedens sp.]HLB70695.1 HEAT repeat domain-containing protein [Candidatus Methanoperedens sp.]